MNKKKKAEKIQKILDEFYSDPAIPLKHDSPFTLLVAVLLSAKCTDARVNTITPKLFEIASTPEKMSQLSLEEIQKIIQPCGLSNRKAKALQELSKILVNKYQSQVPCTFEELESLPGVGHKTASVVMAQAFGHQAFPVDTHIHRCAKRWGLTQGKNVVETEKDLKAIFPKNTWTKIHLQIIYFAREYCQARKHDKQSCPICSWI